MGSCWVKERSWLVLLCDVGMLLKIWFRDWLSFLRSHTDKGCEGIVVENSPQTFYE